MYNHSIYSALAASLKVEYVRWPGHCGNLSRLGVTGH